MTASSTPRVVITEHLDETCADWLADRADVLWYKHDAPGFSDALASADALVVRTYTDVNNNLLDQAPNLRVVGRAGVGLDNIDVPACRARGIAVVYTPDANTQAVVEYVLGLMLDRFRPRTPMTGPDQPAPFHDLRKTEVGTQLDTLTLGILGLGRIGKRLAKAAHALGIPVLACDLLPLEELLSQLDAPLQSHIELVDHATLYAHSDILSIHTDGRAANRHLINAQALAQLKPTALLLNAARGMLIDRPALREWLSQNPDAQAVLDVHDPEPIPPDDPLWHLPNATLLPHLASRTGPAMQNMSWVVRDVWAVLEGQAPAYPAPDAPV
ncbi:MAG: NAD(P)-dependent oxidoreductase [Planctomycetota bacterium]